MKKIGDFIKKLLKPIAPKLKPVPIPVKVRDRKHQRDGNY
jgi:hypothetical protein